MSPEARKLVPFIAAALLVVVALGGLLAWQGGKYPTKNCLASMRTARDVVLSDHSPDLDDNSMASFMRTLDECKNGDDWWAANQKVVPQNKSTKEAQLAEICAVASNTRVCLNR